MMKTSTPVGTTTSFIETYDCLKPDECNVTIDIAKQFMQDHANTEHVARDNNDSRNDTQAFLTSARFQRPFEDRMMRWIKPHWNEYSKKYHIHKQIEDVFDPLYKIQLAETGGGYLNPHYEQQRGRSGMAERFAVWMIYLNDDFKGGETYFTHQNVEITPKQGMLAIWPASYTHRHHAVNNLVGKKWAATGWFRYKIDGITA